MSMVENIKSICEVRGFSIPKLEKVLGFSKGSMYNWDTNSPSVEKVQKVADFFRVSLNYIIYGYDLPEFVKMVNYIKEDRTIEQFSNDTGINVKELYKICLGLLLKPPTIETVKKIASSNSIEFIVSEDDLLEAAGYISDRQGSAIRQRILKELVDQFEEAGFLIRFENENYYEVVYIDYGDHGTVTGVPIDDFIERGLDLLEELTEKYSGADHQTITVREAFDSLDDPQMGVFFRDYLSAPEEKQNELRRIWEIIREAEKGRKPGDKQGGKRNLDD